MRFWNFPANLILVAFQRFTIYSILHGLEKLSMRSDAKLIKYSRNFKA